jgi:alkylation response protein AidB-like acyl-CoA dehydrogenase
MAATISQSSSSIDWVAQADSIAQRISQRASEHDATDAFVADNFALMKDRGFFKAHVPAELGGHGADYGTICAVVRRLAAACGSTGLAYSMHTHLVTLAAWRWRHEDAPTDGLLKRVAAEDLILISSGGSDWLKSTGTAVRVEGGFIINARKIFASGCPAGDLLMTSAVYEDPEAGPTVLHFAVSFKAPGVAILDTWRVMGMRGTGSNDVALKDVFVPDASIAGRRPQGKWHPLFHAISMLAFPIIYSAYVGVAESARQLALEIARKKPVDEGLVHSVGEMETTFACAEIASADMIRIAENERPGPSTTSRVMMRRTMVAKSTIGTVERAMEVVGGSSFYRNLGLERAFRDVQAARFHPLQEKPQFRYSGRIALGLDLDG